MTRDSMDQEPLFEEDKPQRRKNRPKEHAALAYSDLDPAHWREYTDVELGSLWVYEGRGKGNGHSLDYHGNFIPQIATQLLVRYTREEDVVLDLFLGSGTTAIESVNLKRKCVGVEIKPELAESVKVKIGLEHIGKDVLVINGDSSRPETGEKVRDALGTLGASHAQFLMLHPPYWDIIKFSENSDDLSNAASLDGFLKGFKRVTRVGIDLLESGRFAGLVIGDKYAAGELVPLGFLCMQVMMSLGMRLKSIIVKNIEGNEVAKGRANNLWKYRALAGGFYIFKHEYVMVFQKVESGK